MNCKGEYLIVLGLALISFSNSQSQSCPCTHHYQWSWKHYWVFYQRTHCPGHHASIFTGYSEDSCENQGLHNSVRWGERINTSSFVSAVVELQCKSQSSNPTLTECDGSTVDTRQYQFQCIEENGQPIWEAIVHNSIFLFRLWIQLLHSQHHLLISAGDVLMMRSPVDLDLASIPSLTVTVSLLIVLSCHGGPFQVVIFVQSQHVHHDVIWDKDIAILGHEGMSVVTSTCKGTV